MPHWLNVATNFVAVPFCILAAGVVYWANAMGLVPSARDIRNWPAWAFLAAALFFLVNAIRLLF